MNLSDLNAFDKYRVLPDCTISAVQPKAIGVARGMKQPEELTVCAEIQNVADGTSRRLKTAHCPNGTSPSANMAFEFLNELNGVSWKKITNGNHNQVLRQATQTEKNTVKREKKTYLKDWAKDIGAGGSIKRHNEM